jgi:hypothetical protein
MQHEQHSNQDQKLSLHIVHHSQDNIIALQGFGFLPPSQGPPPTQHELLLCPHFANRVTHCLQNPPKTRHTTMRRNMTARSLGSVPKAAWHADVR